MPAVRTRLPHRAVGSDRLQLRADVVERELHGEAVAKPLGELLFDAGQLRFELLVDRAEAAVDAAAALGDRRIGNNVDFAEP